MESFAIVPFVRTPRFSAAPPSAAALSAWDPFAVLGLPREREDDVLAALPGASARSESTTSALVAKLRKRRLQAVREAYLELAARFHPDGSEAAGAASASHDGSAISWLPPLEVFNAINAAYKLLSDPVSTLAYLRRSANATAGVARATSIARANSSDSGAGSISDGAAGSETDARRTATGRNAGAAAPAAHDIDFDEDVERHARAERRLRALEERAGMAVQIEESYAAQLQRQDAAGDGLFVVAGFYGRASAVRWLAEELRGGKAVDTDAILGRFAGSNGGIGSGSSSAAMAPVAAGASATARLAPEQWGCVIDVAGPLQAAVEVTARDSQSEIAVVQLFLPAGSKCGGTSHAAASSSGHHGGSSDAGSAAAAVDGFWDPCDGEDKALWLRYEFLGRVHEVLIGDEEPLKCPLRKHVVRGAAPVFQRALRSLYSPFMASRSAIISSPASAACSSGSKPGSGARSRFGGSSSGSGSARASPATATRENKRAGSGGACGAGSSTPRAVTPSRAAGGKPAAGLAASALGPRSPLGSRSLGSVANTNTTAAASDAAARSRLSIGMFRPAADADTDGKAAHAGVEKQSLGPPADKLSRAAAAAIIDADGAAASVRASGAAPAADEHHSAATDENVTIFAAMVRSPHVTTRSKTTAAVPCGSSSSIGVDSSLMGDCVLPQYPCTPTRKHGDGRSATTAAAGSDGCGEVYTQLKPSVAVLTPPTAPGTASGARFAGGKAGAVPAFDLEGILRAARVAGAAARPVAGTTAAVVAGAAVSDAGSAVAAAGSAAASSLSTSSSGGAGDASTQLDTSGEAAAPGDGGPALVTYTRSVDAATGEVVIMALASPKAATNTRRSHALVARAHARSGAASGAVPAGAASVRQGPRHAPRRHGQYHHASAAGAAGGADTNSVSGVGLSSSSASASSSADAALAAAEAAFAAAQAKIRQLQAQGGVGTDGSSSASSGTAATVAPPAISLVHVTLADGDGGDDAHAGSSGSRTLASSGSSSSPAASRRSSARRANVASASSSANVSAAASAAASADGKLGLTKDITLESDAAAGARWSLPTRIAVAAAAVGALGFGALWLLRRQGMLSDAVLRAVDRVPFAGDLLRDAPSASGSSASAAAAGAVAVAANSGVWSAAAASAGTRTAASAASGASASRLRGRS